MMRQLAEKKVGALTINILAMVSGKQMESIAACSLIMAKERRLSDDVVNWARSRMQKHSKLQTNKAWT